ncbi:capsule assembly Wzi family protein [Marinoscillum sp. MHG1-6]|uniref:capsule assembly Wzi family protein n=1 Tax=Marinoscillum sp. MHG1-6 TaxID=2959627 RepID=UPI0021580CD8|nr:capsule assembly Wzi family protein [Marinoscillum sp. MHG1-6]
MRNKISLLISFLLIGFYSQAQVFVPGSHFEHTKRLEELKKDSLPYLTIQPSIRYESEGFSLIAPLSQTSLNTSYARSYNDGPVWKGKGLTQELHAGFQYKKGLFSATIYPVIFASQNASYPLASVNPNQNPYNYQFGLSPKFDFVQRYGNSGFIYAHPGQSEISFGNDHFRIAASTQNFTLGPAAYNGIMMSNSAPGFPHLMIGTPQKINLKLKNIELGKLEANVFYGLLKESDYYDSIKSNDQRFITGLSLGYEVPYIDGLTIGLNRVMYKNTEYFESRNLYALFRNDENKTNLLGDTLSLANDAFDQLASVFIEWKLPAEDLRLYFEFARNDFGGSFRQTLLEIEHSRAYTLGLAKVFFTKSGKDLYMAFEHTYLPRYDSYNYRPTPAFYTHGMNLHGYTNDGQLLGAGIGPGSVSDYFELTRYSSNEKAGFSLQRIRFDEDYYIARVKPNDFSKVLRHELELTLGLHYARQTGRWLWGIDSKFSYRFNMYYEKKNDKMNLYSNAFVSFLINQD